MLKRKAATLAYKSGDIEFEPLAPPQYIKTPQYKEPLVIDPQSSSISDEFEAQKLRAVSDSLPNDPRLPRSQSASSLPLTDPRSPKSRSPSPDPERQIPLAPFRTDHLGITERHARSILNWQYISAMLGLGAFGRRGITTSILIVGVATAFTGLGLGVVLGVTVLLMAMDIAYIALHAHKGQYTIERSKIKLDENHVEEWCKNVEDKSNTTYLEGTKLIDELKADKKALVRMRKDLLKAERIYKNDLKNAFLHLLTSINGDKNDEKAYLYNTYNVEKGSETNIIIDKIKNDIEKCRNDIDTKERAISLIADKLKKQRIHNFEALARSKNKTWKELEEEILLEIKTKTEIYFKEDIDKLQATQQAIDKEQEARRRIYRLLTEDLLVRRLMVECKINVNSVIKEYEKRKDASITQILQDHFFKMSIFYENEHKRINQFNRIITFGQFIKVAFRNISLSLVLVYVVTALGVVSLSHGTVLWIVLAATVSGLLLGLGNSFATRNEKDVSLKYTKDVAIYKERERRDKFSSLLLVMNAKLKYAPTGQPQPLKTPEILKYLKRDLCFKIIPILVLVGSLARRPMTLLKLLPYSHAFSMAFPVTIILVSMALFLVWDMALSLSYIHKNRHDLDILAISNPHPDANRKLPINDVLNKRIDEKIQQLTRLKYINIAKEDGLSILIHKIIDDNERVQKLITLINTSLDPKTLKKDLLACFETEPKIPEQYKDYHPTRDALIERVEQFQVFKPAFRGMSVASGLPSLFTTQNVAKYTITTLVCAIGIPSLIDVPMPIGMAIGLAVGLFLGVCMYRMDKRKIALDNMLVQKPDEFHQTDSLRKVNDFLDAILTQQNSPDTSPRPFSPLYRRSKGATEAEEVSNYDNRPTNDNYDRF